MVVVTDLAAVNSLLQNAPDRVNLSIILFTPYPFSTLSTLIKTLSSSDILFIIIIYNTHDVSAVREQVSNSNMG